MDKLIRLAITLLSWVIILFALATIALRISLANIDFYKTEIEDWIAREVIPGTSFVGLQGDWDQFNPILRLTRASITLPNKSQTLIIDEIVVEMDYFRSLWHRTPVVSAVTGALKKLSIRKDTERQWWLNDIPLSYTSSGQTVSSFEELIALFPLYIQLELDQFEIIDESSEQKYRVDQVRVDMQQRDETIHWQLSANLPAALGGRLEIKSIVKNDSSLVYLKSNSIQLTRIADLFNLKIGNLESAELGGELWINLIDNEKPVLNGELSIVRGLWKSDPDEIPLPFALNAQVSAWRIDNQWNISSQFESLSVNNETLYGFNTQIKVTSSDEQRLIQGWVEEFELHNLVLLRQPLLNAEMAEILEQSQMQGRLGNIWFSVDPSDFKNLEISADVADFNSNAVKAIPGIEGVNANFILGRQNASLQVTGSQTKLDLADQFRAPFEFDQLDIKANLSLVEDALVISVPSIEGSNADLKISGRAHLETDWAGAPFLYLRAQFGDGKGSSNGKYLPLKLLPEKVIAWLDRGIKTVDISAGELLFHGRVDAVNSFAAQKSGEMMVDFDIDNTEVLFDPDWAAAQQASGRVMFHNSSMDIAIDRVKYDQIQQGKGRVWITDLPNAVVEIDIETSTSTDAALRTWLKVPLAREQAVIGKYLQDVEGSVTASLDLKIPVDKGGGENSVDVKLNFQQASVSAPAWGVELSGIDGDVRVTGKGVSGQGIKANYFNDPIIVDISNTAENRQTIVLAKGEIESRMVLNRLPDFIDQQFEGRSPWQIRLAIANKQDSQQLPALRLRATSALKNTAVSFPEPFSKKPEDQREFYAELEIFELDDIDFKVSYGTNIKARGRLQTDKRGDYRLAAMDMGFSASLREPAPEGLKIYGSLPKFPLDEWIVLFKSIQSDRSLDSTSLTELLDVVDLKIRDTSFFGRNSLNTDFQLTRTHQGFTGIVDSSLIKGEFTIPLSYSAGSPVIANLDYLKFRSEESQSESTGVLPHDLFDIQLRSKVFEYNDVVFTNLILDVQLVTDTLIIDAMSLQRNDLTMNLNANWQYTPGVNEHFTTLNMSIKGKEFGQTIASLDLGDIMHNGEIDIEGRAGWSGELLNIDWGSLIGEAKFVILDGVLKDVQPGTGRLVGLLSLNALPRRLMLDFGDVFIDGLKFDDLKGSFKIEQGNLYTSNTRLDAPSARIYISGRTGLLNRDYDQKMVIIPKIGNTLPIISGITWGNAVGWAVLLVKSLIKKQIDKTVEVEYKVTGTWDEPILEKVREFKEDKPKAGLGRGNR